jgi:hypothetical protein
MTWPASFILIPTGERRYPDHGEWFMTPRMLAPYRHLDVEDDDDDDDDDYGQYRHQRMHWDGPPEDFAIYRLAPWREEEPLL